jgi:hypothetical protein
MFDVTWLRVQPTWVLADALDSCCDALEGGKLSLRAMCEAWRYMHALRDELLARGYGVNGAVDGGECHKMTHSTLTEGGVHGQGEATQGDVKRHWRVEGAY